MWALFTLLTSKLNRDFICHVGYVYTVNEQTGISSAVWAMFSLRRNYMDLSSGVFFFFFFYVDEQQGFQLQCTVDSRATTGNSSPLWALLSLLASNDREFISFVGLAFTVGEQRQGMHLPCGPCFHCWRATTGNSSPLWALLSLLASNYRDIISREGLNFIFDEAKKPSLPDSFKSNLRTFLYLK